MNNHLMIRLIDIALIILLGFIAISRLKIEYVDLPSGDKTRLSSFNIHMAYVHVYQNSFKFNDNQRYWKCRTLGELEKIIKKQKKEYNRQKIDFIVNIRPHKHSIMQRFVDVIDVCQRNDIDKTLDYESYN